MDGGGARGTRGVVTVLGKSRRVAARQRGKRKEKKRGGKGDKPMAIERPTKAARQRAEKRQRRAEKVMLWRSALQLLQRARAALCRLAQKEMAAKKMAPSRKKKKKAGGAVFSSSTEKGAKGRRDWMRDVLFREGRSPIEKKKQRKSEKKSSQFNI